MRVTIEAAGRVAIPKQARERRGLTPGTILDLDELGDHVELRPAAREVRIDRTGPRPVARADADVPRLTAAEARELAGRQH